MGVVGVVTVVQPIRFVFGRLSFFLLLAKLIIVLLSCGCCCFVVCLILETIMMAPAPSSLVLLTNA